jgi:5-oxopent-3-ene-1,2,5-tricarboxylate decarboxylase / 2-hydroxyhepta-2,4-diene-1,7-dioate isomerase
LATGAHLTIPVNTPPYRLSGTVYGTLLNHRSALMALGDAVTKAPYGTAPKAPILYVKPRNTLAVDGADVSIPADVKELEVGACLGLVIARAACRLDEASALEHVAGFLIVNDVSVPHGDYYRPSVRFRARDGFCPLGPQVVARGHIASPDALNIRVYVDGQLHHTSSTSGLIRPIAKLLRDVTEFMSLAAGDVLAVGAAAPAPRARAGQEVSIEIDGLGRLTNRFVGSGA